MAGILIAYFYITLLRVNSEMVISRADQQEQRQMIRMVLSLIFIFWICHTPFWYMFLKTIFLNTHSDHFALATFCTYLAASLNPFCYFFVNTKYYEAFRSFIIAKLSSVTKVRNHLELSLEEKRNSQKDSN